MGFPWVSKLKVKRLWFGTTPTEITSTAAELNILDGVTATTAELNAVADVSGRFVTVTTSTVSITAATHGERIIGLNRAAGITATLPAATGTGNTYTFVVGTTVSSNSDIIKVADATDHMDGGLLVLGAGTDLPGFKAATNDDTITLNGSTTGGYIGDYIVLIDIAANTWLVHGFVGATGTEATMFSNTVS